jgi:DnaJ-class molecular chaperone
MSKTVYMTEWMKAPYDPMHPDARVRYFVSKNLNDYTYEVRKTYSYNNGVYWPVGSNPSSHPTEHEAIEYLKSEMRKGDKSSSIRTNDIYECESCGKHWRPAAWSRSEVREGTCPDCGGQGSLYTSRKRLIKHKLKLKRTKKIKKCRCK